MDIPSDLSDFNSSFGSPIKDNSVKRIIDAIDESDEEEVKQVKHVKPKGKHIKSPMSRQIGLKSDFGKIKSTGTLVFLLFSQEDA